MLTAAVLLFTAAAPLRVGNTARAEETIDSLREKIEALNQQQQTIKQELEEGNYTKEDLIRIKGRNRHSAQ